MRFLSVIFLSCLINSAFAIDIKFVEWRGYNTLLVRNEIQKGDTSVLLKHIEMANPLSHDHIVLLLDSPGGNVAEAMSMVNTIKKRGIKIHAVVPSGAICASACASILFLGSNLKTVEYGGLLGQHSCSRNNGISHTQCNETIANFAIEQGVSHGSVKAFLNYSGPKEMSWFDREQADGWGLTKYAGELSSNFEKSEPLFAEVLGFDFPPQSAWRLDFFGDGFRAFIRTLRDDKRNGEISAYCFESIPGRFFLDFQIQGNSNLIKSSIKKLIISTDKFSFYTSKPLMRSLGEYQSFAVPIPKQYLLPFLEDANNLNIIATTNTNEDIELKTIIATNRKNLIFAANHCASNPDSLTKYGY